MFSSCLAFFNEIHMNLFHMFLLSIAVILTVMSIITSVGAWYWLTDPKTAVVPLTESLLNHYIFVLAALILCEYNEISRWKIFIHQSPFLASVQTLSNQIVWFLVFFFLCFVSFLITVSLFVMGIHKLVIAPQILTSRTRQVLNDFNMSCDDTGKLILKPRPTT